MRTLYHPSLNEMNLSTVLYALSDQIRLDIVKSLDENGEESCSAMEIPIPNSTLSHHYKVLRESGVTRTRLEGTQRLISLRYDDLNSRFPGVLPAVLQGLKNKKSPKSNA
ncbi:ArsR/SmtB family transcription factor [Paenibacillus sedimenti]|uniref:Helix-turn-helix transcriptional regulator n=1 Tax=Paenibacillus sedimenti TaxID=2770274 RepID=A0A926KMR7_9BACL|nr:helix-turn-helix domain-containing protein [Paenibacillus sedimenti]MBD0378890.1 helix-turn-helix transcriptional regulator [Paenibacillus sedimenti]